MEETWMTCGGEGRVPEEDHGMGRGEEFSRGGPHAVDRWLWKMCHLALFIFAVKRWTRLYISLSCCMSFAIFSIA